MAQDKHVPLRSDQREHSRARLIIIFSPFYTSKSPVHSLNSNYLPCAYLFAHNCDPSQRLQDSDLRLSPLFLIKGHIQITYFTFITPITIRFGVGVRIEEHGSVVVSMSWSINYFFQRSSLGCVKTDTLRSNTCRMDLDPDSHHLAM